MFRSWLKTKSVEAFFSENFQRLPHSEPGSAKDAVRYLSWDKQAALMTADSRPDMIVSQNGAFLHDSEPRSIEDAQRLFAAGCTFTLRNVERFDEELRALAESFAGELEGEVAVHTFATPLDVRGFGWHYDCEDVFLVQTAGAKQYFLRQNTVNPEPTIDAMPVDMQFEKETSPVIECTLIRGDWLYVPRGWWHTTRALDDSLSISIGVLSPAAGGVKSSK